MKKVYCLDCDRAIPLHQGAEVGDEILCDYCEAEFVLVRVSPPEIEWVDDDDWGNKDNADDDTARYDWTDATWNDDPDDGR